MVALAMAQVQALGRRQEGCWHCHWDGPRWSYGDVSPRTGRLGDYFVVVALPCEALIYIHLVARTSFTHVPLELIRTLAYLNTHAASFIRFQLQRHRLFAQGLYAQHVHTP